MKKLVIFLDPPHGSDVPGKRSPDGTHLEYKWGRMITSSLLSTLKSQGYMVVVTNPTDKEIGLSNRVKMVSSFAVEPGQTKLLLSIHNNAAGNGTTWEKARGVEIWTTKGQTNSDKIATSILNQLKKDFPELPFRTDTSDGDVDKEENFTVLTGKGYSAVLLEWLFQDNAEDLKLLKCNSTNFKLINSLVVAINNINNTL